MCWSCLSLQGLVADERAGKLVVIVVKSGFRLFGSSAVAFLRRRKIEWYIRATYFAVCRFGTMPVGQYKDPTTRRKGNLCCTGYACNIIVVSCNTLPLRKLKPIRNGLYSLTPGRADLKNLIDYSETEGRYFHNKATAKLDEEKFDCEPQNLHVFISHMTLCASKYRWDHA